MEKRMLAPKEIAVAICDVGSVKAKLSLLQMAVLGVLAGAFIAFGAQGAITISQTLGNIDVGLQKFAFAAIFPVGLMMVVMCGAELFTGNNLMTLGCLSCQFTWKDILKNWVVVYFANFLGSVIIVLMIVKSGMATPGTPAADFVIGLASKKVHLTFAAALLRGILCNIIVVLAVWMATGAKDVISKIFACWFPIMLFVLSGYEHSIANMFFIPLAMSLGAEITMADFLVKNLLPVTLGNLIGGAVIVPIFYYIAYIKGTTLSASNSGAVVNK